MPRSVSTTTAEPASPPDATTQAQARTAISWCGLALDCNAGTLRFAKPGMCIEPSDFARGHAMYKAIAHQDEAAATAFLRRLSLAVPMKIQTVPTDNGSQFTERFTSKTRVPSGKQALDRRCAELAIKHQLRPPRLRQTNGMVERFNGRTSELICQTRFKSAEKLETTHKHYLATNIPKFPRRQSIAAPSGIPTA